MELGFYLLDASVHLNFFKINWIHFVLFDLEADVDAILLLEHESMVLVPNKNCRIFEKILARIRKWYHWKQLLLISVAQSVDQNSPLALGVISWNRNNWIGS